MRVFYVIGAALLAVLAVLLWRRRSAPAITATDAKAEAPAGGLWGGSELQRLAGLLGGGGGGSSDAAHPSTATVAPIVKNPAPAPTPGTSRPTPAPVKNPIPAPTTAPTPAAVGPWGAPPSAPTPAATTLMAVFGQIRGLGGMNVTPTGTRMHR